MAKVEKKDKSDQSVSRAMYRKYRSHRLEDVVGQKHITDSLQGSLKSGNISHAYLFSGPRGIGKTSVARILAHMVNDLPYDDDANHLDIIEIDAASNRNIDDIRDLREKVHIAPVQARYKVYIIDEVHMLTMFSFNALLKTLEEPPEHVIFILATTEPHKLPETITSRTQHYQFKPIDTLAAAKHLASIAKKEKLEFDEAALELLAEHGRGSMRDSISMLDQLASSGSKITTALVEETLGLVPQKTIDELLNSAQSGDIKSLNQHLDKVQATGADTGALIRQIFTAVKSSLIDNAEPEPRQLTLMNDLLEATKGYDSELYLESALFKYALSSTRQIDSETPAKTSKAQTIAKLPQADLIIETKIATNTDQTEIKKSSETHPPKANQTKAEAVSSLSEDLWQQIIDDIKSSNNTLAGLLRQTKANFDNSKLDIVCPYSFHAKRLSTSAYLSRLTKAAKAALGKNIKLNISYSETNAKNTSYIEETMTIEPPDAKLMSVKDIMGGGEIINV